MMEMTQDVSYVPPAVFFHKIDTGEVEMDRDNPVGYLHILDQDEPIYKEKMSIGRDPGCDIVVDSPQISRLHATIKVKPMKHIVFICVHGKSNFLNGDELDPDFFYQILDGAEIDFRSVKAIFKEKKPVTPDTCMETMDERYRENTLSSPGNREDEEESLAQDTVAQVERSEDEPAAEEEEECTQFEDEPFEEAAVSATQAENPFIEDSQDAAMKPPGGGFKLPRRPSFETQEQEISELETQPSEVFLKPPQKEPSGEKKKKGNQSGEKTVEEKDESLEEQTKLAEESQLSTMELRVSLGESETQPSLGETSPFDTQDDTQRHYSCSKVRKALLYEDDTDLEIVHINGTLDIELDVKPDIKELEDNSRVAEVAAEAGAQTSPLVHRRAPRTMSFTEIEEFRSSQISSTPISAQRDDDSVDGAGIGGDENKGIGKEKPPVSSEADKIDESVVVEESMDDIIEASDDEAPMPKVPTDFCIKDTQERSAEESKLDVSAGMIPESQEEEWQDSLDTNITAVEVLPKDKIPEEPEKTVEIVEMKSRVSEEEGKADKSNAADNPMDRSNKADSEDEFHDSLCETPKREGMSEKKSRRKKPSRLSLRRSTSPKKPALTPKAIAATMKEASPDKIEKVQVEEQDVESLDSAKDVEPSSSKEVPQVEEAQVDGSSESGVDKEADAPKEKLQTSSEETILEAEKSSTFTLAEEPKSPKRAAEAAGPSTLSEKTPAEKKYKRTARERSVTPEISIAEEVKMSPRMAKIAAVGKLGDSSPRSAAKKKVQAVHCGLGTNDPVKQKIMVGHATKAEEANKTEEETSEMKKPARSRRTRGNPVVMLTPLKKAVIASACGPDHGEEVTDDEAMVASETKKRGRGRPKKNTIVQKPATSDSEDKDTARGQKRAVKVDEPKTASDEPLAKSPRKGPVVEKAPVEPEPVGRGCRRRTMSKKLLEPLEELKEVPRTMKTRPTRATKTEVWEKPMASPKVLEKKPAARPSRAKKIVEPEKEAPKGRRGTRRNLEAETSPAPPLAKKERMSRKDGVNVVEKRGRQSSASSSVASSSDSQSRTRTKYYVLFSGFEGSLTEEKELVAKLGGYVKEEVPEVKHKGEEFILVLNGSFKRTLKVLDIMCFGSPIVTEKWLKACKKDNTFVDAWDYILRDVAAEKKFGFNLGECLTKARENHDALSDWTVHFTQNVVPKGANLKKCVEALGGKYLASKPKSWPNDKLMIVSCENDKRIYQAIKKQTKNIKNALFVTVQGFFECLQQQAIVALDSFALN